MRYRVHHVVSAVLFVVLIALILLSIGLSIFGCATHRSVHVRSCTAYGEMPVGCSMHYVREFKDRTEVTCERTVLLHAKFRHTSQVYTYRCKN